MGQTMGQRKLSMGKLRLRQLLAALFALILLGAPMPKAAAEDAYPSVDMFAASDSIKGIAGADHTKKDWFGGIRHSINNVFLDSCIYHPEHEWVKKGFVAPYEFEGETFYFSLPIEIRHVVPECNQNNMSVSIIFLLRWIDDKTFLIDEDSREPGHAYYAPATTGYGGKCIRAYWHYLMENLVAEGWHIDNFILGNEVNMHNQWHYSGGSDARTVAEKYADAFFVMRDAVRKYTDVSRCSISVEHSWQNDDGGRGISARNFLHLFDSRLAEKGSNGDWCVATHLYPAMLYNTRIWEEPHGLNPVRDDAKIIDGRNLSVMTNYIRDTFGEQHRVMLTEQGFSDECGAEAQAACLAYTYYAAMYDPMVDSFIINSQNEGTTDTEEGRKSLNFDITGTLAEQVYTRIGSGNPADAEWIAQTCLPVIGVNSWADIIPNFGSAVRRKSGFVLENGRGCYYQDGDIDTSYTKWHPDNGRYYLLVNGREADMPTGLPGNGYTGWYRGEDGSIYWAENGFRQGYRENDPAYRGQEIYDPLTDAWYWLDNVQGGAMTADKDVYQESEAGAWSGKNDGTGKWVRYDVHGRMVKGWDGDHYFDPVFGTMAKGTVRIDGELYTFNQETGALEAAHGRIDDSCTGWYYGGNKFYLLVRGTEVNVPEGLPEGDYTGWYKGADGSVLWAENGIRQGFREDNPAYRGQEIYDPLTDAWYWLDNVQGGAMTVSKDVYQESDAGAWAEEADGTGKWVRYDAHGRMVKGWDGDHYFDLTFGTMAKGSVQIDGVTFAFDPVTGSLNK